MTYANDIAEKEARKSINNKNITDKLPSDDTQNKFLSLFFFSLHRNEAPQERDVIYYVLKYENIATKKKRNVLFIFRSRCVAEYFTTTVVILR